MNLNSILHLTASFIIIIFSIFVFIKNKKNIHFAIFGTVIFIWLFASSLAYMSPLESEILFWFKISYIGIIFIPTTFYNFIFNLLGRKHNKIVLFNYTMSFFFVILLSFPNYFIEGLYEYPWGYYPKVSLIVHPLFLLFFNVLFTISIISLFLGFHSRANMLSASDKNRLRYVFFGSLIGPLGAVDFLPNYGINIYPFGFIFMVIFPLIFAYAILRYRLMDINVVVKRTAVYSLSAGILVSLFIVIVLAVTKYLTGFFGITSFAIMAIAAIVIALLSNPIKNRIQTMIHRIFYKKTYDYYSTIQKVSHEFASTFNLRKIYSFVGETILSTLGLKNIYLLSLFPDKTYRMVYFTTYEKKDGIKREKAVNIDKESSVREYNIENRIQESEGTINGKSEIVKLLKKSNDVVIREELPQIHAIKQEVVDRDSTDLKPFKGEAVVPIFIDGKLELMMVLGEKLSGDIFTSEDIKLLHTISDQTAIAVKNARLYIDKLRSDRLASIGMISATFAHEIKNPLTSIKTFAQLLPERHSYTEFRENFSRIVIDGVNRIDGLIRDLLDFSSGKISVEMSTLNITGLIDNIIDEVVTQLQLKNNKISIEKDYENIEVDMSGDEKRLRQAFANIILNGCQAIPDTRDDGKIRVSINPGEE